MAIVYAPSNPTAVPGVDVKKLRFQVGAMLHFTGDLVVAVLTGASV